MLVWLAPGARAGAISVSPAAPLEGQDVEIVVTTTSAVPPEQFHAGDRLVVTDPEGCSYARAVTPTDGVVRAVYPGSFQPEAANAPSCRAAANTFVAGTATRDQYTVHLDPYRPPSQAPLITAPDKDFRVLLTDHADYVRTQRVQVAGVGFAPGQAVNVQVDTPDGAAGAAYLNLPAQADPAGRVTASFQLPKGLDDSKDVGRWTVHLVPVSPGGPKTEDLQGFDVAPTSIGVAWRTASVPASAGRAGPFTAILDATYDGPGGTPTPLTSGDVAGGVLDLVLERSGLGTVQTATASYDATLQAWKTSFQLSKDAPAGPGYHLRVTSGRSDRFGNPIADAATPDFSISQVTVTPTFTLARTSLERANADRGLSLAVRLTYPSGAPVSADDLKSPTNPDGALQGRLVHAGEPVPGSLFIGVPVGNGVWQFEDQILPRDTPLGTVAFQLLPVDANPSASPPNPVRTDLLTQPMTVAGTHPRIELSFLRDGAATPGVLRGQEVVVRARPLYPNGAVMASDDVDDGGRAFLRVVPGDPSKAFVRGFQYDAANAWWQTTYVVKATDPVGTWSLQATFTDDWSNDNSTTRDLRVGLQLATQVSTSTPARTGNITLTSAMSLPGSSDPLAGTMDASLVDPAGHALGAPVALQPITGGRFQGKLVFPANATLGTYTLVVHGASSADAGQDLIPVQLGSSALQVKAFNVTATSVARLAHIGAEVRLAYPNGELLGPAKATPSLAFRPASGPDVPVPLVYNATGKAWRADHVPAMGATLGTGRFVLAAQDTSGNRLTEFLGPAVRVDPAPIQVVGLAPLRTQYLRGETVTVRAGLAFSDGSLPTVDAVPATLRAGNTTVAALTLRYDAATHAWQGSSTLAYDVPLSSAGMPWRVTVAKDAARDADGNAGPTTNRTADLSVRPALLGVTILQQEQIDGGALRVRFAVTAGDGTPVAVPPQTLRAVIVRDGQVSNETVRVVAQDGGYVATLFPRAGLLAGQYSLRIEGGDQLGNALTSLESQAFDVQPVEPHRSPAPGLVPLVALLAAGAAVLRVVRRRS